MKYRFARFPGFRAKAVTLSYDDGAMDDIRMVEILNRHGMKGTFNICSGLIPTEEDTDRNRPTAKEYAALYDSGHHEIAVHGDNHTALIKSAPIDGIRQILTDRTALEQIFGRFVRGMAYPDIGRTNQEIKTYLRQLGIVYARCCGNETHGFDLPADWLELAPTCHHNDPALFDCVERFLTEDPRKKYVSRRDSMLFYLWGHSFEFSSKNNWETLERFCEAIGGREEIWYATNMEIYEYLHAYDSLLFTADNSMVYNPTLLTVYFDIDGKEYQVAPGETRKL